MRSIGMSSVWRWALPLIVGLAPSIGAAAPLAKESCDALKAEQVSLTSSGSRADLTRGAAWGKVNLAADRIKKVARLIEVDEQILFRCASPPPEADTTAEAKPKPKPKPKAQAQKAAQQPAQKSAEKAPEAATSESGGKLAPQSAKATPDTPKKLTKAEIQAEKKRAAVAVKAPVDVGGAPPVKPGRSKQGDAFVSPPDAPKSTLKPPAEAGSATAR